MILLNRYIAPLWWTSKNIYNMAASQVEESPAPWPKRLASSNIDLFVSMYNLFYIK